MRVMKLQEQTLKALANRFLDTRICVEKSVRKNCQITLLPSNIIDSELTRIEAARKQLVLPSDEQLRHYTDT